MEGSVEVPAWLEGVTVFDLALVSFLCWGLWIVGRKSNNRGASYFAIGYLMTYSSPYSLSQASPDLHDSGHDQPHPGSTVESEVKPIHHGHALSTAGNPLKLAHNVWLGCKGREAQGQAD